MMGVIEKCCLKRFACELSWNSIEYQIKNKEMAVPSCFIKVSIDLSYSLYSLGAIIFISSRLSLIFFDDSWVETPWCFNVLRWTGNSLCEWKHSQKTKAKCKISQSELKEKCSSSLLFSKLSSSLSARLLCPCFRVRGR